MSSSALLLRSLAYTGPGRPDAQVEFERGLNVVCGASDTGKSFIAESIDFMLGGGDPPRDIPERVGYDKASLTIEIVSLSKSYRLERSTGGGDFRRFDGEDQKGTPSELHAKHAQGRDDSLSAWLLLAIGLSSKSIRKNSRGIIRSLSFRDVARLVILQQGEISSKTSPYLTGQFVTRTAELSALKLMLTGTDDSAVVSVRKAVEIEMSSAKIEVIDSVIDDLRSQVVGDDTTSEELTAQFERLQATIARSSAELRQAQEALDERMKGRRDTYQTLNQAIARQDEIANLLARFELLRSHYNVDLKRLAAISEAGHFISHMPNGSCPLCGAAPDQQHVDSPCDGNVASIADAADAEQSKVRQLLKELAATMGDLQAEFRNLDGRRVDLLGQARNLDRVIGETLSPNVGGLREGYGELLEKASEIRRKLTVRERIAYWDAQKAALHSAAEAPTAPAAEVVTDISKSVLHELCLVVERILGAWNFPGAGRVSFDERTCDFVCDGKPRGSFGAGFRAIISAAASVGLLEYCLERGRPHPGFLVLESPLLAYWKPESSEDNLRGSDLKDRFYRYLEEKHTNNQIVVVENEHPPASLNIGSRLTVFTRNPVEGRYGFFPASQGT